MLDEFKNTLSRVLSQHSDWKNLLNSWTKGFFPLTALSPRGAWAAALFARLSEHCGDSVLIIMPDENEARNMLSDLRLFTDRAILFPWWGTMLYHDVSAQSAIFGKRAAVLGSLVSGERKIVVTSLRASLGRIPPPHSFSQNLLKLEKGGQFDSMDIERHLGKFGYNRVPRVSVPGEFSLRGEVLDLYPLGSDAAFRIVFDWDKIEQIRLFDPFSQISSEERENLILQPLKELLWNKDNIEQLKNSNRIDIGYELLDSLESTGFCRGEELFFPLVFDEVCTLQDYIGEKGVSIFFDYERLENVEVTMVKEYDALYEYAMAEDRYVPQPQHIVISLEDMRNSRKRRLVLNGLVSDETSLDLRCEPGRSFFSNINYMKDEFASLIEAGYEIFVFAESESQSQRIGYLLKDIDGLKVGAARISAGFFLPEAKILAVQENEIFGRRKKAPDSLEHSKSEIIETFVDLDPGDYVVHVNHGIGLFKGIKRINAANSERDYITLEYSGEETVFVPIEQVNLIQRYIGQEGRSPKLDRIGSVSWEKKKNRVRQSVADLADRLIKLYARRETAQGYAFPADDDFQISFEASFPWEETKDQLSAIADVKADMETPKPMDRIICGDVGYGKTEIAMRAAFKAVLGGRQVACLCPTTILAEQHHETFTERFKRFPVKVGMLSRFVPASERKKILQGLSDGEIDIIIGTHRILSKDVKPRNLGLLIIDEEQRFGVKHKERLKELKASIDCLTLSATPIPRTLHMSLVKIRDMSMLKSAPKNRQPIETFIQSFDENLIAGAIRREVERGGQVFYLHNQVRTLESIRKFLRQLLPDVFIEIAHGQMPARELEDVMHRFVHGAFQVLLSTTIIENGIDIPNVNTIIIDRADRYGISQLYQLRGRVGRSGRLAYAYLLYPENAQLSELAMKRLQVISDFTELGSGFKVAMKDLEVRGAGNLLGSQQSGDISSVGFDLYLRLLDAAIREKTQSDGHDEDHESYLELDYSGFIPDSYVTDESQKMAIYKKIAMVQSDADLEQVHAELHDRYGPLPDEVHSLISMAEVRIICRKLKIITLKERRGHVQVIFGKVSLISVDKVMKLMQSSGSRVKLDSSRPEALLLETGEVGLKEKSVFIRERLESLL